MSLKKTQIEFYSHSDIESGVLRCFVSSERISPTELNMVPQLAVTRIIWVDGCNKPMKKRKIRVQSRL